MRTARRGASRFAVPQPLLNGARPSMTATHCAPPVPDRHAAPAAMKQVKPAGLTVISSPEIQLSGHPRRPVGV